ncbi:MAG TPA: phosphodiester glycosidase family protein [Actinomycetota bacterium]
MKATISRLLGLVTTFALVTAVLSNTAGAGNVRDRDRGQLPKKKIVTRNIAPGLTFTKIIQKKIPLRTYILTADVKNQPLTMDVALAGAAMPTRTQTSRIAKRNGAIAAVNGDFGTFSGGPAHPFEQDGQLVRSSTTPGFLFAASKDEQQLFVAPPKQFVSMTLPDGTVLPIDRWNDGGPGTGEITASTPFGGSLEPPPPGSCSARLLPSGTPVPSTTGDGMQQDFTVNETGCFESGMLRNGGAVLSAIPASDEALQLLSLVPGTAVTLRWTFGWPNVYDAIGGVPQLVADGRSVVGTCTASVCRRNPRTGVGITADGKVLLVVVDGRQKKFSIGLTLNQFAWLFKRLGAVSALNLDGGGSSTMVIKGEVVNRPSSGFERRVTNALLVLPGPDPEEP